MHTRRIASIALVATLGLALPACSSSDKAGSDTATTVGTAPGPTIPGNESCPFSGSTDTQREPGGAAATELTKIAPATEGCIDNITFDFAPTLAPSVTGYEAPESNNGAAVLDVTLAQTTLGSGITYGTTLTPKNLNYVSKVEQTAAEGSIIWRITLDKQRPFLVSSSNVPAQLVLAIG